MASPADSHSPEQMEARRRFAVEVVEKLRSAGYTALWAGGCVRDLLMGRHPDDYDVATNATPAQVREVFGRRRTLAVGESFGVIIVLGPKPAGQVEVATFRTEGPYADGRRPENVDFSTPEEDAQRRDFTINGMFFDPVAEAVIDFVGGEHDLHAGIVRAIGNPHARMMEDKLRMLRAVRFAATLDFELDETTANAIREMAREILIVSWERIAAELRKMLSHRHRRRAVRLAHQLGLLEQILPELAPQLAADDDPEWTHALNILDRLETRRFETAAAVLLRGLPTPSQRRKGEEAAGSVGAACRRLKLSNDEREEIGWLVANQSALEGAEGFPPARLKRLLADERARELLAIAKARNAADNVESPSVQFVEDYLQRTPTEEINPPPLVTGADLIQLGMCPGPEFKGQLERIRDAQLNGEVASRDAALQRLRKLAGDASS